MSIKITLENGDTLTYTDTIEGITEQSDLASLFSGESYLDGVRIERHVDKDNDGVLRITHAEWLDDCQETSFHGYVLDRMNAEGVDSVFCWADGEMNESRVLTEMVNYYHGFQEAVNNLINLDGLEFVFGNGYDHHILFNLVSREIVREYLREHDLY